MSKQPARWKSYSFLLLNVVLWGLAFYFVKPSLTVTTPFRYLFYRYSLAVILSLPIVMYYLRKTKLSWSFIGKLTLLELCGTTLCLGLLYFGLKFSTALETNLLSSASPLFVTLGGVLILKEHEEKHEWFGLGLAMIGTMMLVGLSSIDSLRPGNTFSLLGSALILASNMANMIYFPFAKKIYKDMPKFLVTSLSFYVGCVSFLGLSLLELNGSIPTLIDVAKLELLHPSVQLATIYMALFGSIIGLTCLIKGQDGIEVSEATLFGYLSPLIYIPVGIYFFHETITWWQLIALGITILGVYLAEQRHRQRKRASTNVKSKPAAPKARRRLAAA